MRSFCQDLQIVKHLLFPNRAGFSQAQRLDNFYQAQAEHYDAFRERLLFGRAELISQTIPPGFAGCWLDIGAGTGRNLEYALPLIKKSSEILLVDLCAPLLDVARNRICRLGLANASVHQVDAACFKPSRKQVDIVTFSYSLSMMPNWSAVIENALSIVRPGGLVGVADFYVSGKHSIFARNFWPLWFSRDGVHLSAERLNKLQEVTECLHCNEQRSPIPFLPYLRVPYFVYVGRTRW